MKRTIEERTENADQLYRNAKLVMPNNDDSETSTKAKVPLILVHKDDNISDNDANSSNEKLTEQYNSGNGMKFADVAQMYFEDVSDDETTDNESNTLTTTCSKLKRRKDGSKKERLDDIDEEEKEIDHFQITEFEKNSSPSSLSPCTSDTSLDDSTITVDVTADEPEKYKKTEELSILVPKSELAEFIETNSNGNGLRNEISDEDHDNLFTLSNKSSIIDGEQQDQINGYSINISEESDRTLILRKYLNEYENQIRTRKKPPNDPKQLTEFKSVKHNYYYKEHSNDETEANVEDESDKPPKMHKNIGNPLKTEDSDEDAESLPSFICSTTEPLIETSVESTFRFKASSNYPHEHTVSPNTSNEGEASLTTTSFKSQAMTDAEIEKLQTDFEEVRNQSQTFEHIGALAQTMATKEWVECGEYLNNQLKNVTRVGKTWPTFIEDKGISELSIIYQLFSIYESKFFKKSKKLIERYSSGKVERMSKSTKLVHVLTEMTGWSQLLSWEDRIRAYVYELCNLGNVSSNSSLGPSYVRIFQGANGPAS
ncbi:hypothetical protein SNEBB_007512 [Seison nebaliae]|nr:hypothetical protein SNEBB_007512 [Seison nebaliae]